MEAQAMDQEKESVMNMLESLVLDSSEVLPCIINI